MNTSSGGYRDHGSRAGPPDSVGRTPPVDGTPRSEGPAIPESADSASATAERPAAPDGPAYEELGERLRARRQEAGISLRELARRIDVSASLVSQIETGKVQPSVSTLYNLVSELGGSIDELFFGEPPSTDGHAGEEMVSDVESALAGLADAVLEHPPIPPVQRAGDRKAVQFNSGVRWERLTSRSVPGIEFLYVVYDPGAQSSPSDDYQRHSGHEWGYVMTGTLSVAVGFEEHVLEPGDAINYPSTTPHRLVNRGDEPVEAIWFQFG